MWLIVSHFTMRLMMFALKLSNNTPENLNKLGWLDLVSNSTPKRFHALALRLTKTIGTAERNCHVPLVWSDDTTLAAVLGASPKTYRSHRNGLKEAGFLFDIPSGLGYRKTIKVLKMPEWNELETLYIALDAYNAYCDRKKSAPLLWVIRAVKRAIRDREAIESFSLENDDDIQLKNPQTPTETLDETQPPWGTSPLDLGANSPTPPYIDNKKTIPFQEERDKRDARKPETKPTHQPKKNPAEVVDFEHLRSIRVCIVQAFGSFGKAVDEGVVMKLSRAYARQGATPEALQITLDDKLTRLFGDGYKPGRVAAFLLKDADEWQPSPAKNAKGFQNKRRQGSPKTQSEIKVGANNFDENSYQTPELSPELSRISELVAQGFSYADAYELAQRK